VGDAPTTPPVLVAKARAVAGQGLAGDRYYARAGTWSDYPDQTGVHLTLIEAEVLEVVGLTGVEARRNVVTRGVRLNELVAERFSIGAVFGGPEPRGRRPLRRHGTYRADGDRLRRHHDHDPHPAVDRRRDRMAMGARRARGGPRCGSGGDARAFAVGGAGAPRADEGDVR
jgi:hypothetical protein